jgi:hypothetical protein
MQTVAKHIITTSTTENIWKKFISWAEAQDKNRFLWLSLAIIGHGCVLTIMTMLAIIFSGNNFIFWPFAIAAMTAAVVSNLAALPTKITIPVFFFSILIDLIIIVNCILIGFSSAGVYR